MPTEGSQVKFVICSPEAYANLPIKDENTIYLVVQDNLDS